MVRLIAIVCSVLLVQGCDVFSPTYRELCEEVQSLASNQALLDRLTIWADEEVFAKPLDEMLSTHVVGVWPSQFTYAENVDWYEFGMPQDTVAMLVLKYGGDGSRDLDAVFLGRVSGHGLLIVADEHSAFRIEGASPERVSSRIGYMCQR